MFCCCCCARCRLIIWLLHSVLLRLGLLLLLLVLRRAPPRLLLLLLLHMCGHRLGASLLSTVRRSCNSNSSNALVGGTIEHSCCCGRAWCA